MTSEAPTQSQPAPRVESYPVNPETTRASNNWLKKIGNKVVRLAGHVGLTIPTELFNYIGAGLTAGGIGLAGLKQLGYEGILLQGAVISTSLAPLVAAAGVTSAVLGTMIGWRGAKHTGGVERTLYTTIKGLMPVALPLLTLANPALGVAYAGISAASTIISMRGRK